MNVRWMYPHRTQVVLLMVAMVAVGLMTVLVIRQQQDQANGQVYLEAGGSVGSNPFVPLLAPSVTIGENPERSGSPGNPTGATTSFQTPASPANQPGCDVEKIISHLAADTRAGEAWIHVLNFDRTLSWSGGSRIEIQQLSAYVHELRPRVLTEDLRVTNYQLINGAAIAVQSVLEKGTAILVDAKGIARVRCACGNPLTPMIQSKTPPTYRGTPWPGFHSQQVAVSQHSPPCGRNESYDGERCQQIVSCPHSAYGGDDVWCDGPGQWGSSDRGRRPDEQWSDTNGRPDPPPVKPGRSDERQHPDKPVSHDQLADPDRQAHPDQPQRPDRPERLNEPPHPDKPTPPDQSPQPDRPVRPDEPPHSDKPTRPEKREQPEKEQPEKIEQPEESSHADRPIPPQKDEHQDKDKPTLVRGPAPSNNGEHQDGPKRADKPEKSSKPERVVQPETSGKPEKAETSKHGEGPQGGI